MELKLAQIESTVTSPDFSEAFNKRLEAKFAEAKELSVLNESQKRLFKLLCALRKKLALEDGVPSYQVFSNQVAIAISRDQPTSIEALLAIRGMGPAKVRAYGEWLIRVIRQFLAA